jgi:hypothetical protein
LHRFVEETDEETKLRIGVVDCMMEKAHEGMVT